MLLISEHLNDYTITVNKQNSDCGEFVQMRMVKGDNDMIFAMSTEQLEVLFIKIQEAVNE